MKVTFLGTGTSQGVPVIGCTCETCQSEDPKDYRLRSSMLIASSGKNIVIDTGPDFRQQMLRKRVRQLEAVLFTHEHRDHIAGLDDIRAFNFIQQKSMDVFAEERVFRALKFEYAYVFAEKKYPGVPQINQHLISTDPFNIGVLEIIPIRLMHYRLPILGFRIADFAYLTDANYISDEEREKIFESKVLVINALQKKSHVSHFNLEQALMEIEKINPGKAYLTHISHKMGLHDEVNRQLPENVFLAYDGLKIEI